MLKVQAVCQICRQSVGPHVKRPAATCVQMSRQPWVGTQPTVTWRFNLYQATYWLIRKGDIDPTFPLMGGFLPLRRVILVVIEISANPMKKIDFCDDVITFCVHKNCSSIAPQKYIQNPLLYYLEGAGQRYLSNYLAYRNSPIKICRISRGNEWKHFKHCTCKL